MEEQSIFQADLSQTSNDHILSAAKWSRFLGIVFLIAAGIGLLGVMGMSFFAADSFNEIFANAARANPQFAFLENLPGAIFITLMIIAVAFMVFLGILLVNIGKHGTAYASSSEEMAFVNAFKAAKNYFLFSAIMSIIGILFSILGLF